MAADKANTAHVDHPEHEAALTGALALANLFSNCVEAFGLIHPSHKWEKEEQLLLSKLGIQQARLLIWGDIVGISSPPKSVTDRAVPKHPSSAYPDLKEPTFFGPRDERLDEPETRTTIEQALSAIVDRSSHLTREEMMGKYGLKPPRRFAVEYQPALDTNRLEAFREKYELLKEVAEAYAHINTRRSNSIIQTSWVIAEQPKFASFIKLTQEKVDYLIGLLDAKERVDRGMRMDIKGFGWHLTMDRTRTAFDTSKLRLIAEACRNEYPEYVGATKEALDNINREMRENMPASSPYAKPLVTEKTASPSANEAQAIGAEHKRPGLLGLFKSFGKSRDTVKGRSKSVAGLSPSLDEPERSKSDSGPTMRDGEDTNDLEPLRSKSVGAILEPHTSIEEALRQNRLEQIPTQDPLKEPMQHTEPLGSRIVSRHDQYHGIARTETKDLWQDGAVLE